MPKKYWLFKSEPGCFGIDHLAAEPNQTASWDGVRNYQARNMLRDDIKKGDMVFFYHSNAKPPGVIGECVVTKSGYPDHTAMDPNGEHFDPKVTKENPIWYMVDVKLHKKYDNLISISELKNASALKGMVVCQRGSRLSITPVTSSEWKTVQAMAKAAKNK